LTGLDNIIEQLEEQKAAIDRAISALGEISHRPLGSLAKKALAPVKPTHKKRHMSAEGRKRIGDAARRRWALAKGLPWPEPEAEPAKKKRGPAAAE
jgi:hypothetical protein